jgi:hypothetical protein
MTTNNTFRFRSKRSEVFTYDILINVALVISRRKPVRNDGTEKKKIYCAVSKTFENVRKRKRFDRIAEQ